MQKNNLLYFSLFFYLASTIPFALIIFLNSSDYFTYGIDGNLGFFMPIILVLVALLLAALGKRNTFRNYLLFIIIFSLINYSMIIFAGLYGFKNP
ncbi:hypothetical protein [Psychrobacillus sp. MER TA 171]|uniref:hypothetical protein n=1 Tax=Psychrobacillus sp. MER TA 171 TaxID=2939577 RepID=UPI00203B3ABD|nr:hypothetical protein [Psychrobacillus sp. MER TA 171]MCM3357238.1 hypothetical protein [Psychrobacillus sp. MER TA 171]